MHSERAPATGTAGRRARRESVHAKFIRDEPLRPGPACRHHVFNFRFEFSICSLRIRTSVHRSVDCFVFLTNKYTNCCEAQRPGPRSDRDRNSTERLNNNKVAERAASGWSGRPARPKCDRSEGSRSLVRHCPHGYGRRTSQHFNLIDRISRRLSALRTGRPACTDKSLGSVAARRHTERRRTYRMIHTRHQQQQIFVSNSNASESVSNRICMSRHLDCRGFVRSAGERRRESVRRNGN